MRIKPDIAGRKKHCYLLPVYGDRAHLRLYFICAFLLQRKQNKNGQKSIRYKKAALPLFQYLCWLINNKFSSTKSNETQI